MRRHSGRTAPSAAVGGAEPTANRQSFGRSARSGWRAAGALLAGTIAACSGTAPARLASLDSAFYARSDTNATVVYAPRIHAGAKLGDSAGLDATYAIDSWTGASIDVTTAATKAIHEIRREVTTGAYYEFKDITVSGGYRYSGENDYWSNGGVVNVIADLADNNATLGLSLLGSSDTIAKSGDVAATKRPTGSTGARLSFSQVLDPKTVFQASAEVVRLTGFLSSYYRYVGFENGGLCYGTASDCIQESHPHERMRTALSARLRRSFGDRVSGSLDFRHYFDDWGIMSETVSPELSVLVGDHGTFTAAYRYYTQTDADFYLPRYLGDASQYRYFTRDRKMSPMYTHRLGLEYTHGIPLGESGDTILELAARAGGTWFHYKAFIGLTDVYAIEGTGLVGVTFR
jgi:Protein of unknown function (DUF3570)